VNVRSFLYLLSLTNLLECFALQNTLPFLVGAVIVKPMKVNNFFSLSGSVFNDSAHFATSRNVREW
jgi:hypothetical protein